MAVDDDQRGIGSRLMDDVVDRARAAGCARVALDVAEGNDGARRLYERRGMTVEAQSSRLYFIPGSRAYRMVLSL